jgi:fatty acyl-CoA reductase
MDPVQRAQIVEDLDILINSAASIYFNDPLMELLKTNYYGAVRILELANECKRLEVFSHVSTAYVCANQPPGSTIKEVFGQDQCKDDFEEQVKNLISLDRATQEEKEEQLCWGYPNTYTYTKNLAERHIHRYGKKLRIVINRPSLIIQCTAEPFIGWTDTVSAVGTINFPLGMGFSRNFYIPEGRRDLITADTCSNAIIASTAYIGQ